MKKILTVVLAILLCVFPFLGIRQAFAEEFIGDYKALCLMDANSGEVAYEKDANKKLPVASMTKIMTLCVIFDEIESGKLSFDDKVVASDNAQGMGGSQVFIESGGEYEVEELIKAIAIASANDACVAMAEHIAGSERGFVAMMNEKAKALSMTDTNFVNCTGLPCVNGYSTARDMCLCMRELLKTDKYYEYAGVWMADFVHPEGRITSISNTNKLLRRSIGVDAGKTGYTAEAKHCITATAKRGDTRLIACVIGANSSKDRFNLAEKLLSFGFGEFESVPLIQKGVAVEKLAEIKRGKESFCKGVATDSYYAFTKKRVTPSEQVEITYFKTTAPIKQGEEIGCATVYKDGVEIKKIPLVAEKSVDRKGLFDIFG